MYGRRSFAALDSATVAIPNSWSPEQFLPGKLMQGPNYIARLKSYLGANNFPRVSCNRTRNFYFTCLDNLSEFKQRSWVGSSNGHSFTVVLWKFGVCFSQGLDHRRTWERSTKLYRGLISHCPYFQTIDIVNILEGTHYLRYTGNYLAYIFIATCAALPTCLIITQE